MKKDIFIISVFTLCFSLFLTAQTKKEIVEIQKTLDKDYLRELSETLKKEYEDREARVLDYLQRTGEKRAHTLEDGFSSMYIIDISEEGTPIFYATDNANAAARTLTTHMYGFFGLNTEGQGMNIGVWDENRARGSHQEFTVSGTNNSSRMTYGDNAITGSSTNHATHVAGTMVARGALAGARGMAFRANIVSYNWQNDQSEVLDAAALGILVTNHSYGTPMYNPQTGNFQLGDWVPGCYTSVSRSWDNIAYGNPMTLSVVSAGNEGNTNPPAPLAPGLDKLVGNKVSKNNLVVANASNVSRNSDGTLTNLQINSSSSTGPSDDLRIKPDIAGVGTNLNSAMGNDDTSYDVLTGTSMAAPNVSGSILLLQQYYNGLYGNFMRAATLKGLVCLTADDDLVRVGPDPYSGWGLLNMKAASDVIADKGVGSIIEENTLTTGQTYTKTITVNTAGTLLAGISWTDYPGIAKGSLNDTAPALINDLDIRVTKDGETFFPWKLNPSNPAQAIKGDNAVDNVEIIRIDNAQPGTYTVTVTAKGSIFQSGGQHYSLIVTGEDTTASVVANTLDKFRIYPNPATDSIYISYENQISIDQVEIYDVLGKKVLTSNVDGNNSINISQLNSGVYFVKVYSGNNQATQKVIKK